MNSYEEWLISEKQWIGVYCRKTIKKMVCLTIPMAIVIMTALFAGLALSSGEKTEGILESASGGFFMGLMISAVFLMFLLPGLRPGRYVKKIRSNVKKLALTDGEKEQLGREMLAADKDHIISYTLTGPNSKGTPARFILTPHYAFLEGSYPYSILVRLSDIREIRMDEEEKTAVTRRAKTKTYYRFTLFTIGFFQKDRVEQESEDFPDIAMGFFDASIRARIMKLLEETEIRITQNTKAAL
ncbi:hypothetical protein AALB16_05090 [Lachnospiraceae bacterium 62-35]